LEFLADQDPLTDTRNRRSFLALLATALNEATEHSPVALLFIDLDGLKPINDHYGHAAGDVLLTAVARRTGRSLRSDDAIGRMGGDEFAVLLRPCHSPDCVSKVAHAILTSVREPLDVEGTVITPSVSIGMAISVPGESPESLLRRADVALYRAKHAGGDRMEGGS
jgi:diguanylate cyclase (GGDEF)-like protein